MCSMICDSLLFCFFNLSQQTGEKAPAGVVPSDREEGLKPPLTPKLFFLTDTTAAVEGSLSDCFSLKT